MKPYNYMKLLIFVAVFYLFGCSILSKPESFILEVPSEKRISENYCGPASLAMVFGYWGMEMSQEEIAKHILIEKLNGTLPIDMLLFARQQGFNAEIYESDLYDLRHRIRQGYPLILLVKIKDYDFVVAYGFIDDRIILNADKKRAISIDKLDKMWKPTKYWALLITPRGEKDG